MLLVFKGSADKSQPTLFSNLVNHYAEETSASIIHPAQATSTLADISDLTAFYNQGDEATPVATNTIQDNSVQAYAPTSTDYLMNFKANQVVEYTVKPGDSISTIASDFNVSTDTIIWANNISNPNLLSLGQTLKIPPVSGVLHTIKSGDTVASIAKKYKADADKIIAFNTIPDDQTLIAGEEIIVPGGELPGPKPSIRLPTTKTSSIYAPVGDGQCVAFVQAHGYKNLHGNAYQWAKYINTPYPVPGGVVVMKGGRYGHIAIITSVKQNSIQIVEQNYYGLYVISHREIALNSRLIVGYIR